MVTSVARCTSSKLERYRGWIGVSGLAEAESTVLLISATLVRGVVVHYPDTYLQ